VYEILWHPSTIPSIEWIFEREIMLLPKNVRIKLHQQNCGKKAKLRKVLWLINWTVLNTATVTPAAAATTTTTTTTTTTLPPIPPLPPVVVVVVVVVVDLGRVLWQ